ncbi:MAG TPA: hypothetical protein ENG73_04700 [Desulfobacterales bacterium]|nr:MAG: hypothetical protein DRP41_07905 [Thermodesulfobacteriota bacterium]HDG97453.1 hypothetical protein [Desulfobacterales bacterium]
MRNFLTILIIISGLYLLFNLPDPRYADYNLTAKIWIIIAALGVQIWRCYLSYDPKRIFKWFAGGFAVGLTGGILYSFNYIPDSALLDKIRVILGDGALISSITILFFIFNRE